MQFSLGCGIGEVPIPKPRLFLGACLSPGVCDKAEDGMNVPAREAMLVVLIKVLLFIRWVFGESMWGKRRGASFVETSDLVGVAPLIRRWDPKEQFPIPKRSSRQKDRSRGLLRSGACRACKFRTFPHEAR